MFVVLLHEFGKVPILDVDVLGAEPDAILFGNSNGSLVVFEQR